MALRSETLMGGRTIQQRTFPRIGMYREMVLTIAARNTNSSKCPQTQSRQDAGGTGKKITPKKITLGSDHDTN